MVREKVSKRDLYSVGCQFFSWSDYKSLPDFYSLLRVNLLETRYDGRQGRIVTRT